MSNSIVESIFDAGISEMLAEDKAAEATKAGTLRGGSVGLYIAEQNKIAGKCARLSYLRYKGIGVEDTEPGRKLMFRAGIANEELWYETLSKTYKGPILREEEVPTKWFTDNSIPVTGRPDIVLCTGTNENPIPMVGIELKLVSAIWTARDVLIDSKPKFDHLVQSAHYSWQLGINFELWYTNRVDFASNDMVDRCLPDYGTEKFNRLAEYMQLGFYQITRAKKSNNLYKKRIEEEEFITLYSKGKYGYFEGGCWAAPIKILPFKVGYLLRWDSDGFLNYTCTLPGSEEFKTIITRENIKAYYNLLSKIDSTDQLPPKPVTLKGDMTAANYSQCDYCPLASVCKKPEKSASKWTAEVKQFLGNKKS